MREPPVILRDAVFEACDLLDAICARLQLPDRMHAYAALQAVLHATREGLPASSTLRLAAGMPLFIGGLTVQDWQLNTGETGPDTFLHRVGDRLPLNFPVPAASTVTGVLAVLATRVDAGTLAGLQASTRGFLSSPHSPDRLPPGQP